MLLARIVYHPTAIATDFLKAYGLDETTEFWCESVTGRITWNSR